MNNHQGFCGKLGAERVSLGSKNLYKMLGILQIGGSSISWDMKLVITDKSEKRWLGFDRKEPQS